MDIADWLRGLGLAKYAPAFDENAIDWDVLPGLTTPLSPTTRQARCGSAKPASG